MLLPLGPMTILPEINKSEYILSEFSKEKIIPRNILEQSRGIVVLNVIRAGFVFSVKMGTGLVLSRMNNRTWSAPIIISTAGLGLGNFGGDMLEIVLVLNTPAALRAFCHRSNVTLSGNLKPVIGPKDELEEVEDAAIYSYTRTKGYYVGLDISGTVLMERKASNERLYEKGIIPRRVLEGYVSPPSNLELYRILEEMTGFGQMDINSKIEFEDPNLTYPSTETRKNPLATVFTPIEVTDSDSAKKAAPKKQPEQIAIALYDYTPSHSDELDFKEGDQIIITRKTESDWWMGIRNGKRGLVPATYVELSESQENSEKGSIVSNNDL